MQGIYTGRCLLHQDSKRKLLNIHTTLQGSLTAPPCSESVFWVVFTKPVLLSRAQFKEFRKASLIYLFIKTYLHTIYVIVPHALIEISAMVSILWHW